ncbi:MAG: LPS export ABC transporter ATP-binding protein [Puniceicoccales bacterium]|jgi:lipopolysaccharide export system ATP-binding protein|nr:LPS export ABC transporter ATP-binding protein [Puniceicoccales bacterium]
MNREEDTTGELRAVDIAKSHGRREVLRGVDIELRSGEIVGLLGPNGAGKTTSFHIIVGLLRPTRGEVFLNGTRVTSMPMYRRARRGIGYLPQEPSVFRRLSVEDNLRAVAEHLSLTKAEQRERIETLLEDLGLTALRKQEAVTLSGGERRRLEIARALVPQPRFILMDEPFSGVDPINVADLQRMILALRERTIGILITDHNVRETLSIVDRAYLIHDGRVLCRGDRQALLNDPQSRKFYLGEHFSL